VKVVYCDELKAGEAIYLDDLVIKSEEDRCFEEKMRKVI
jgi:hypothetical protein